MPHAPLLQKLADIGINPYLLRWIQSYLTNRKQYVAVEGASSPMLQVLSGVPQGSVLGPLLFLLYLNDVAHCISGESQVNFYADDIALYRIIRSPEDYIFLQADIDAVAACLETKLLTLNARKCCYLFLSRRNLNSIPPPCLTMNGSHMTRVTSYKYLGVQITANLMWSEHINKICNKTRKLIGILYRSFYSHSTPGTMLKLHSSFIQPHLEYATAVWDPFLRKDIELLEGVQKFGLKVCTKSWNCSYEELLDQSRLPTLQSR